MIVKKAIAIAAPMLFGAIALGGASQASAQEADQAEPSTRLEEIVVTGSRIRRTNAESAVPLQVFDPLEIEEIGTTDLAEALNELPGVSESISPTNSNNQIQTNGLSTVELRRLGDDRTLVLINGKRVVSNSGNSDRVSLSTIPVGFVERTEITTGGASAIYGSDAIAGVANFLLEDDYEGIEIDVRQELPEATGGNEERFNFRFGDRFASDRGYFLFAASYRDEEAVFADRSRPKSIRAVEFDDPATGSNDTFANEIFAPGCDVNNEDKHCLLGSLSGSTPGGVFEGDAWFRDGQWFNDQSLQPPDRSGSQDFFGDFDGFNFRPGRTLEGSRELINAAVTSSFEFTPEIAGSITVMYSDIDTATFTGFETLNDDDAFGLLDAFEIGNMSSSHPFIPPEVEETRSGSVSFDRRLVELGQQARINNRKTYRTFADLSGAFGDSYEWEVYTTYGLFEQEARNPNEVNFLNAQFALDIEDDGAGGFQCEDAGARAAGCVPLNLFGEGSISPEAADYIRYNGFATQERTQLTGGAYLTGDLFELPTGAVKFVIGGEYRREKQETDGDRDGDLVGGVDGDPMTNDVFVTSLSTFPSVSSEYEVIEGFAELDVPIIEDKLLFQGALRVANYDTVGNVSSYNLGAVFSPIDEIRIRAQFSRSQRAPNLTEIFSPPRPDSDDLRDPCDGLEPDGSGLSEPDGVGGENADLAVVSANCLSEAGIQAFFADPDNAGDPFEFDGSVQGPNAGNPNVKEETAETFTAGVVFAPRFFDDFVITVDYYEIDIEDAITSIATQDTVDLCYSAANFPNNRFCDVISRNPFNGEVVEVINFQENLNQEQVSGIDVTAAFEVELGGLPGLLDVDLRYSHYFDSDVTFLGIGDVFLTTSDLGEIEQSEDEWRARFRYENEGFRLSYAATFESGGVDDLLNDPNPTDNRFFRVSDQIYHRLNASYNFGEDDRYRIYGGIKNLRDDLGPLVPTGTDAGGSRNITTNLNEPVGREYFVGVRLRF